MTLLEWLGRGKGKRSDLARRLGISASHLSEILHGNGRPSLAVAVAIENETGGAVRPRDFILDGADRNSAPSPAE